MIHALIVLSVLASCQDAKKPTKPSEDDDEIVAGFPEGDARPLPGRVKWELADAITAKTATRERMDLSGYWRFAAVDEQDTAVKRGEMGWIDLPASPASDGSNVFDWRFR